MLRTAVRPSPLDHRARGVVHQSSGIGDTGMDALGLVVFAQAFG
jgi:hypothetical protein